MDQCITPQSAAIDEGKFPIVHRGAPVGTLYKGRYLSLEQLDLGLSITSL